MEQEGTIQFQMNWTRTSPLPDAMLGDLLPVRQQLFRQGWIGVDSLGVGYGNLSFRPGVEGPFMVSGTGTGGYPEVTAEHFTQVMTVDIAGNSLICEGPVAASSESMTHAALYALSREIHAVIHIHSGELWSGLMGVVPTTDRGVPYGTPAMAMEMARLYREGDLPQQKILVMAGHQGGIMSFGRSLQEALDCLYHVQSWMEGHSTQ